VSDKWAEYDKQFRGRWWHNDGRWWEGLRDFGTALLVVAVAYGLEALLS
tara:strand:+ start:1411 stop:1557 length:147 start_codon:yes stop_codon:yes gene_type:complete